MSRELDEQESLIIRELIRNPRFSDNEVSRRTKIPVMSVNRKRKQLEKEGLLEYHTLLNTSESGTGTFKIKRLYIIKLKIGSTIEDFVSGLKADKKVRDFYPRFVEDAWLGEKDGHLALLLLMGATSDSQMTDILNGQVIRSLKQREGENAIVEINSININLPIRRHNNYCPSLNFEKGILKDDWKDEWIFVDNSKNSDIIKKQKKVTEF